MDDQERSIAQRAVQMCDVNVDWRNLRALTGGASRVSFTADGISDASRAVVIQVARAQSEADMEIEADVLRNAHAAGVPVPALVGQFVIDDRQVLVSRQVAGDTVPRRIMRELDEESREALVRDVGSAAAVLHTRCVRPERLDEVDLLTTYIERLHASGWSRPVLEAAATMLERTRPPTATPAVVHGDLRLGNWIVEQGRLAAIVDWELARWGDPIADLAWMTLTPWRFGGPGEVGGLASTATLFAAYRDGGGVVPDEEVFSWHRAVGLFVWAVMCIGQCEAHRSGARRSHELAVIGRRVTENEMELIDWMTA